MKNDCANLRNQFIKNLLNTAGVGTCTAENFRAIGEFVGVI